MKQTPFIHTSIGMICLKCLKLYHLYKIIIFKYINIYIKLYNLKLYHLWAFHETNSIHPYYIIYLFWLTWLVDRHSLCTRQLALLLLLALA